MSKQGWCATCGAKQGSNDRCPSCAYARAVTTAWRERTQTVGSVSPGGKWTVRLAGPQAQRRPWWQRLLARAGWKP